jgi:uncharacterized membrane protein
VRKSTIAILLAGSISLGACTTAPNNKTLETAATGAAVGGVGGAAVGAVVPGVSVIQGAAVGAAIGGLTGAVWADNNQDGYADGYVREGQYYPGTPQGYNSTLGSVATGAAIGAVGGAAIGAVVPGVSVLTGAVVGAVVGGVAGAIWADQNNDGVVDGYVRVGQSYPGAPPAQPAPTYAPPARSGERG